jgi:signal peptidase I
MKTNVLKTELQQIRELIRAKRYDEARAGLSVLDHPIAQRWLAKLDEIAPPSTKSALPWRKICILAIRHPSIRTFEIIAADPGASAIRASSWVFFSTFGGLAASILLLALLSIVVLILLGSAPSGGASLLYDGFILCLIISLGALAQFWVGIGAMQIAAKILGGKGSASKLAFAVASFTSLSLIFLPIAFLAMVFPIIQTLIAATNLYGIMLTILVVAAVNRFGWVKSFLVGLIPIAVSLALVAGINMATVRFINQGPAMYPTLQSDDLVLISRVNYLLGEPARGDIVVFHVPGQSDEEPPYIKRVIGLPGETIETRNTRIYVNGTELAEPYITEPCIPERCGDRTWVLGPDQYFVLGDNRNHSSDSRAFGPVSRDRLIGQAVFLYWPPSKWGTVE